MYRGLELERGSIKKVTTKNKKWPNNAPNAYFYRMFQLDLNTDAQSQFGQMAQKLIHNMLIRAGETYYRLAEVEFYVFAEEHETFNDDLTHQHPRQLLNGVWYLHRKSPERTGLEITFGNNEQKIYGGVLIRAIQNTEDEKDYVYGPPAVVKALMEASGVTKNQLESQPVNRNQWVSLVENPSPFTDEIYACPRHPEGNEKKKFTDAPYRFFVLPQKKHVMKEKVIIPYLVKTLGKEKVANIFPGSAMPK